MTNPKTYISIGLVFIGIGLLLFLFQKTNINYKNPLDLAIKGERFRFYFPLGTSILLSILLSLVFYIFRK